MFYIHRIAIMAAVSFTLLMAQQVSTVVSYSTFNDGLAIDSVGNIYASRYAGTTITKITPDGTTSIFASGLKSPNGIAFGPDGYLYVPQASGNSIVRIAPDGMVLPFIDIPFPSSVFFDHDGSLLVTQYTVNSISKISRIDTGMTVTTFLSGSPLNGPISICRDDSGMLYIANFTDGKVFRYIAQDNIEEVADIPGWLGFMTIVKNTLLVTGYQQNRIYRIALNEGGAVSFAGTGTAGNIDGPAVTARFSQPNGIAATVTGDTIYISEYSSRSLRRITGMTAILGRERETHAVRSFSLSPIYPNPFNPAASISFSIPEAGRVYLGIYSLLGQEVGVVVNDIREAGRHTVTLDGTALSSGVYLLRLYYAGHTIVQKGVLVK